MLGLFGAGSDSTSRKKVKVDILKKFLEPSFSMFENLETHVTVDEYGASIDDLQFKDIQTIDTKWLVLTCFQCLSYWNGIIYITPLTLLLLL